MSLLQFFYSLQYVTVKCPQRLIKLFWDKAKGKRIFKFNKSFIKE